MRWSDPPGAVRSIGISGSVRHRLAGCVPRVPQAPRGPDHDPRAGGRCRCVGDRGVRWRRSASVLGDHL